MLIPSFALGRTQEMLALLALLMREGKLKKQPIYIGGLGRVFTEIYDLEAHRTHRQHTNLQLHEALQLIVLEKGQAEKMKLSGGKIFVITAGMMSENTAAHDLAARMIGDERQSIFFVGYADPDSPGGTVEGGEARRNVCVQPQRRAGDAQLRHAGFRFDGAREPRGFAGVCRAGFAARGSARPRRRRFARVV